MSRFLDGVALAIAWALCMTLSLAGIALYAAETTGRTVRQVVREMFRR